MLFIEKGDASQAISQSVAFMQLGGQWATQISKFSVGISFIVAPLLIQKLKDHYSAKQLQELSQQPLPNKEIQTDILSGKESQQIDQLCAHAAAAMVQTYGIDRRDESSALIQRVYEAENFTITMAKGTDGRMTYQVQSAQQKDEMVLNFAVDGAGAVEFLKPNQMSVQEQILFLQVGESLEQEQAAQQLHTANGNVTQTQPTVSPDPVQRVKDQLARYGDLAPKGAKAIVVADLLIKNSPEEYRGGQPAFGKVSGQYYAMQRTGDSIEVVPTVEKEGANADQKILGVRKTKRPLYSFSLKTGQIQVAASGFDQSRFAKMYDTWSASQKQQQQLNQLAQKTQPRSPSQNKLLSSFALG